MISRHVITAASPLCPVNMDALASAALDGFSVELPYFSGPIFGLPNVVTPHMAGSTHEALATIARTAANDIARVLRGEEPVYAVNHPQRRRA
jgi:D-3-phosphoglycerate dehydrogenase / 2-oxoglutarate reductase